jgi:hypothetical protein
MRQLSLFPVLRTLGLLFWLSLPVIGLAFWLGSGFIGDQILSRAYNHKKSLQADTQMAWQMKKKITAIDVEILTSKGISLVSVKTNHSTLKSIMFEFAIAEPSKLETKLAQELGLSPQRVKELIRYQALDNQH